MKRLGGLDRFRPVAVLLVIAIHTGPLLSISPWVNDLLTDSLARLAVPFFFTVSGWFLLPKVRQQGMAALTPFVKKGLLLYGLSTLIYLPVRIYSGGWEGLTAWDILRDLIFDGTFYHLWYLPASLLGGGLAALLVQALPRLAGPVCGLLYLLGLLGDSYYGLAAALPPLRACYDVLFTYCFDQTRNGLFFAPLFFLLGGRLTGWASVSPSRPVLAVLASIGLLLAEGLLVRQFQLPRQDAMYLSLPLCLWTLIRALTCVPLPPLPGLRRVCTVLYLIHPLCIIGVRGAAKLLDCTWLLVECSPVHYLAVTAAAGLTAAPFALWNPKARGSVPLRAWTELDTNALRHNLRVLSALLPHGCALMTVVKADAYGHGLAQVAKVCRQEGVSAFAVATVEEGAALRRLGIRGEILVLGYTPPQQARRLAHYRLTQAVINLSHARQLEAQGRRIKVHLKLDTGMHRLGLPWDAPQTLLQVCACRHLTVCGIFTHLADAESLTPESMARTRRQIRRFRQAADALTQAGYPLPCHTLSSYGLLNYAPAPSSAYVRIGIALYGVLSREGDHPRLSPALRPVLSLRARVAQVHRLEAGERAGYDGLFAPDHPAKVALVTIGYADGYPRSLSCGAGRVLIRGQAAPIAGLICMDQMLVDVTEIPGVRPGDMVTLIGQDGDQTITAEQVAAAADTITNELLSRLGSRLERVLR